MGRGKRLATAGVGAPQLPQARIGLSDTDTRMRLAPPVSVVVPDPPVVATTPPAPASSNPAANARQRKQLKPELYCTDARCLWMTGGGRCPNHGGPAFTPERQALARKRSAERITAEELERLYELAGITADA